VTELAGDGLLAELATRGAILSGHFRLSSGRHSNRFVQKFRMLEDPALLERIAATLLARMAPLDVACVVSAAVGGIVLGYECARQLGTRAIFVEKEAGEPKLRRGFGIDPGDRVLVVEDVVTTGLSIREVIDVVHAHGGVVAAVGVLVARAAVDVGAPVHAVLDLPIESFEPDACPQCAAGDPITEPGSRFLR
jgi:orotate phosphoribosyltransferase